MNEKKCSQCFTAFTVFDADQAFYKKMDVPEPTLCPSCRQQRRLAFRNERTLYPRACDLCAKKVVAIYPEKTPFPVYCQDCWWSDKWNAQDFALDYDPSKPFFDQIIELRNRVPRISSLVITSENSEYTNNVGNLKDCYLLFAAEDDEECMYGRLVHNCKNCTDCDCTYESERCYGSVGITKSYTTHFSERSQNCTDVLFGYNLSGCSSCILCTNLRNKSYCIENKQVTKEEYQKRFAEIMASRESLEAARVTFEKMKGETIVKYADIIKSENVTGDNLDNCRDTVRAFDVRNSRSSGYNSDTLDPTDCYDTNNTYYNSELCYEVMGVLKAYQSQFCVYVFYASDMTYCDSCHNMNSGVGCVGLRKADYSILNKQYSKEEYEKLKAEIIARMKREGLWGEMMPATMSTFAFNETLAMSYFPLTKEECVKRGWRWTDSMPGSYGKETMKPGDVPGRIEDTKDSIVDEVLACTHCGKNYRITKKELAVYRALHLPIPLMAPECRLLERLSKRTPRNLWHRQCMCALPGHDHTGHCANEFETAYAPERPEKVFCEACYQKEVI
jgi:hypothetical protein